MRHAFSLTPVKNRLLLGSFKCPLRRVRPPRVGAHTGALRQQAPGLDLPRISLGFPGAFPAFQRNDERRGSRLPVTVSSPVGGFTLPQSEKRNVWVPTQRCPSPSLVILMKTLWSFVYSLVHLPDGGGHGVSSLILYGCILLCSRMSLNFPLARQHLNFMTLGCVLVFIYLFIVCFVFDW